MKKVLFFLFSTIGTAGCMGQAASSDQVKSLDLYAGSFSTLNSNHSVSINPSVFGYAGSFYFENRYNYEASNTASVNAGIKLLRKLKPVEVIPMFGIVVGNFKAVTTEMQTSITIQNWRLSSDNQFSIDYARPKNHLYLNWSVLRYRIYKGFEIGGTTSLQKKSSEQSILDPGLAIAWTIHDWNLRFYNYNFSDARRYYSLAVHYHVHFSISR